MKSAKSKPPIVRGVTASEPRIDADEVLARMQKAYARTAQYYRRTQAQTIEFGRGPVALVFMADLHLGSSGVDYERLFAEARIVRELPNTWLVLVGDLLDNFVHSKLMHVRHQAQASIDDEWALVRRFLEIVAPKLLVSVGGNHERWTLTLAGIDYFRSVLAQIVPRAIYDANDVLIRVKVGKIGIDLRVRHQWQGNSIYNATHGIERAARFDQNFALGVGAHTHVASLARQFVVNGRTHLALLCGSYKVYDPFARERGFAQANGDTAVAAVLFPDGDMLGLNRLERVREWVKRSG